MSDNLNNIIGAKDSGVDYMLTISQSTSFNKILDIINKYKKFMELMAYTS